MIALTVEFGWKRSLIVLKNASVNASKIEEIYLEQPTELAVLDKENYV